MAAATCITCVNLIVDNNNINHLHAGGVRAHIAAAVHGLVAQAICMAILIARNPAPRGNVRAGSKLLGAVAERAKMGFVHAPHALHLGDDKLRVSLHAHVRQSMPHGRLQAQNEPLILGNIVCCASQKLSRLAHHVQRR